MEVVYLVQISYMLLTTYRSGEIWEEVMVTITKFRQLVKWIFCLKLGP